MLDFYTMRAILLVLFLFISFFYTSNSYAEKAQIQNVQIVNSYETWFEYDPIQGNTVPLKYLLSKDTLFSIEWNNFEWYDIEWSLIIEIGSKTYESLVYDKSNTKTQIYFRTSNITSLLLESNSSSFRFQFCPNWIQDINCWFSNTIQVKDISTKFSDTYSELQYYLEDSNIILAKSKVDAKYTPTIAIIDDWISIQHSDLIWHNWINNWEINWNGIDDDNNWYIDDYYGWNFIDDNNIMFPKWDHWTNVAWIISANTNNSIGVTGISNDSKLMPLIVCDDDDWCLKENIIDSINYAVENKADIINLSIWWNWFNYNSEISEAIQNAKENNIIVVISSWNGDKLLTWNGIDTTSFKISPVCNEEKSSDIIWVSALSVFSDLSKTWLRTNWSNYWECSDFYAYGESITTLSKDWNYEIVDGTSFSAPIITWIIALWFNKYGELDRDLVYNALLKSTNTWHWIDAKLYLDELEKAIELMEEEAQLQENQKIEEEWKELEKQQELDKQKELDALKEQEAENNKYSILYEKIDLIEKRKPGNLKKLIPWFKRLKEQSKFENYAELIDKIINYIDTNY